MSKKELEQDVQKVQEEKEETGITETIKKTRVITFDKPYQFEGNTYSNLDISRLDDLTTDDLLKAEGIFLRSGGDAINPETTIRYAILIAHIASDKPIEFFGKLPSKEGMKIKKQVMSFFLRMG